MNTIGATTAYCTGGLYIYWGSACSILYGQAMSTEPRKIYMRRYRHNGVFCPTVGTDYDRQQAAILDAAANEVGFAYIHGVGTRQPQDDGVIYYSLEWMGW